uniref:Uncharacterized protein n=1 Tax=Anopheles farauti TaxID=69004 RepID=A0A182Q5A8_9DIPT
MLSEPRSDSARKPNGWWLAGAVQLSHRTALKSARRISLHRPAQGSIHMVGMQPPAGRGDTGTAQMILHGFTAHHQGAVLPQSFNVVVVRVAGRIIICLPPAFGAAAHAGEAVGVGFFFLCLLYLPSYGTSFFVRLRAELEEHARLRAKGASGVEIVRACCLVPIITTTKRRMKRNGQS